MLTDLSPIQSSLTKRPFSTTRFKQFEIPVRLMILFEKSNLIALSDNTPSRRNEMAISRNLDMGIEKHEAFALSPCAIRIWTDKLEETCAFYTETLPFQIKIDGRVDGWIIVQSSRRCNTPVRVVIYNPKDVF